MSPFEELRDSLVDEVRMGDRAHVAKGLENHDLGLRQRVH
jgi:hypothetical protein